MNTTSRRGGWKTKGKHFALLVLKIANGCALLYLGLLILLLQSGSARFDSRFGKIAREAMNRPELVESMKKQWAKGELFELQPKDISSNYDILQPVRAMFSNVLQSHRILIGRTTTGGHAKVLVIFAETNDGGDAWAIELDAPS